MTSKVGVWKKGATLMPSRKRPSQILYVLDYALAKVLTVS